MVVHQVSNLERVNFIKFFEIEMIGAKSCLVNRLMTIHIFKKVSAIFHIIVYRPLRIFKRLSAPKIMTVVLELCNCILTQNIRIQQ